MSYINDLVQPISAAGNEEKRLKLVQYGESKAGKSFRAATAAQWGPVLFLDFDGNMSRTATDFATHPDREKMTFVSLNPFSDGKEAEQQIRKLLDELVAEADKPRFATIVIDTWTSWERIVMNALLGPAAQGAGVVERTPQKEHYIRNAQVQKTWIQKFFNGLRPYNVIINCHTKMLKDERTGMMKPALAATGGLGLELTRFSNELHFLDYRNGKHTVRVVPDSLYDAFTKIVDKPKDGIMADNSLAPFSAMAFKLEAK